MRKTSSLECTILRNSHLDLTWDKKFSDKQEQTALEIMKPILQKLIKGCLYEKDTIDSTHTYTKMTNNVIDH